MLEGESQRNVFNMQWRIYVTSDLNGKEIVETFYEKEFLILLILH